MKTLIKKMHGRERMLFWFLSVFVMFSFVSYIYFVNQTIQNVLLRGRLEQSAPLLHSEVGQLESVYIALKNKITLEYAYAEGFKDVTIAKFISRKSLGKVLSLNNEI